MISCPAPDFNSQYPYYSCLINSICELRVIWFLTIPSIYFYKAFNNLESSSLSLEFLFLGALLTRFKFKIIIRIFGIRCCYWFERLKMRIKSKSVLEYETLIISKHWNTEKTVWLGLQNFRLLSSRQNFDVTTKFWFGKERLCWFNKINFWFDNKDFVESTKICLGQQTNFVSWKVTKRFVTPTKNLSQWSLKS